MLMRHGCIYATGKVLEELTLLLRKNLDWFFSFTFLPPRECCTHPQRPKAVENWPNMASCPAYLEDLYCDGSPYHRSSPRFLSISSSLVSSMGEKAPWGAEPSIELGPAWHQADVLPSELRRTHWATRHALSCAASKWATPHPSKLRRTRLPWRTVPPAPPRSCSAASFWQSQLLLLLVHILLV